MLTSDKTKCAADTKSFDELLTDLALRLLKVDPRSIDNEIRQSVADIGEHYRVDNVQLRKFSADCSATTLLNWWSSSSAIGLSADLPNDAIPWASPLILRGDVVRIGQLSDIPPQAQTGRQLLEADGLHAALLVPVVVGEQVYGSLLFSSKKDRRWSDDIVRESQVLGEVLAHAHERAQIHNSLWTKEARLRAVLENQSEFIVRWLPDGTRTWVNDQYCEFFQQPRESLIGTSFGSGLVHDADREKVTQKIMIMTPDKPVQTADHEVLLPNGEIGWHYWTDKGIFDDSGALIEIQSVGRDITETRRARREIERRAEFTHRLAIMSASLLRSPIEKTVARINEAFAETCARYALDSAGLWWFFGDTSVSAERYAGWRSDPDNQRRPPDYQAETTVPWFVAQVLKGKIIQIDDVYDLPEEASADQAALLGWGARALLGIPVSADNKIAGCCVFNSAERRVWDEETIQELGLLGDAITAACYRHRSTAEILRSEQDLARSQQVGRLGNFAFTLDDASRGFPPQGKLEVSPQFCELFDIDTRVPSFEQVAAKIHPDDRNRFLNGVKKGMETGVDFQEIYRIVRTDGTVIHVDDRSVYEADETGRTKRIFGTVQNMTDQIEAKHKLEISLAEIEKLKDQLQEENVYLREEIRAAQGFDKIIGDSPQLRQALVAAEKVAPTSVPVLILGETGTGKELVAQAIHDLSGRKDSALISVNCAALSRDLIESELFGHEKGAFTGAYNQRKGRFERANGGTLFLDEIGDLPGESQAKLLRVLQTGGFERVGGLETLHVDARLIAATNKNLKRAVDEGEFRADLYYRISSYPIELPPLRERPEDIPPLTEFFVQKHAKRMGKDIQSISAKTISYLSNQKWLGNVRELEGTILRALITTAGPVLNYSETQKTKPESTALTDAFSANTSTSLRDAKRQHIISVLKSTRWVISGKFGAAEMMGVPPSTLRSMMKRLGIKRAA